MTVMPSSVIEITSTYLEPERGTRMALTALLRKVALQCWNHPREGGRTEKKNIRRGSLTHCTLSRGNKAYFAEYVTSI